VDATTTPTPALADTARLTVAQATRASRRALQACLDGCPEYLGLGEGLDPGPEGAARLIEEIEADPLRRLYLFSLRRGGVPAALLDLWLDQPEPGTAHLGLLLVREALQGQGLGREAVATLEAAMAEGGWRTLRLSVTDENRQAGEFWARLGFATVGRLDGGVTVYEKPLG
jgi:RimJ/RimL family protein N-acetyltransferase